MDCELRVRMWATICISAKVFLTIYITTDYYDCGNEPLYLWSFIALLLMFIMHVNSVIVIDMGLCSIFCRNIFVFYILVQASIALIWSMMGSYWLIKNKLMGNNCIEGMALVGYITIQLILYIIGSFSVFCTYKYFKGVYKQKQAKNKIHNLLENFYKNPKILREKSLDDLCGEDKIVLLNTPLVDIEKDIIMRLCTLTVEEQEVDEKCGICLVNFEAGNQITRIQCTHRFHFECLVAWYNIKPNCPYCKKAFREALLKRHMENALGLQGDNEV